MRLALGRVLSRLPKGFHADPDYLLLAPLAECKRSITILHLINRRLESAWSAKDYDFSRATVLQHWETGLEDMRRTCAHADWINAKEIVNGVHAFDLSE